MMQGRNLSYPISLNEPTHVSYRAHGRTYTKAPLLPTDHLSETVCQGEWLEYVKGQPFYHMVAYFDKLHLHTTSLMIEHEAVVDQNRLGQGNCCCHAPGKPVNALPKVRRISGILLNRIIAMSQWFRNSLVIDSMPTSPTPPHRKDSALLKP